MEVDIDSNAASLACMWVHGRIGLGEFLLGKGGDDSELMLTGARGGTSKGLLFAIKLAASVGGDGSCSKGRQEDRLEMHPKVGNGQKFTVVVCDYA